jgi:hypothetical protein
LPWSKETHFAFPSKFKKAVKVLLMLQAKKMGKPFHLKSPFWKLPKELLLVIIYQMSVQ